MRRPSLTLPFALVGLIGGGLYGFCLGRPTFGASYPWPFVAAVSICTALTCAGFGALLSRRQTAQSIDSQVSATIFWSFIAGVVNGTVLLACVAFYEGLGQSRTQFAVAFVIGAWIVGAISSVPFMVPLGWIVAANERVGGRIGSIVRAVQMRGVYRALLVSLSVATLLAPRAHGHHKPPLLLHLPALFTFIAFATLVYFTLRDRAAKAAFVDVEALEGWERDAPDAPKVVVGDSQRLDYGIGDATFRRPGHAPHAYRSIARATRVIIGDAMICRAQAASAFRDSLGGALVVAATVAYHALLT